MSSRRRSGRTGLRRAVEWGGAWFYGSNLGLSPFLVDADVASVWVRWPTGSADPLNDGFINEEDTLIRIVTNWNVNSDNGGAQALDPNNAYFGLIAWDAIDPIQYDGVITQGVVPHPANHSYDWVYRWNAPGLFQNTAGLITSGASDLTISSKAMRKMPPGRGLLAVFGVIDELGATNFWSWSWDVRFAAKTEMRHR